MAGSSPLSLLLFSVLWLGSSFLLIIYLVSWDFPGKNMLPLTWQRMLCVYVFYSLRPTHIWREPGKLRYGYLGVLLVISGLQYVVKKYYNVVKGRTKFKDAIRMYYFVKNSGKFCSCFGYLKAKEWSTLLESEMRMESTRVNFILFSIDYFVISLYYLEVKLVKCYEIKIPWYSS